LKDLLQTQVNISESLINVFIVERLGVNGVWEIKAHPFFAGIK